MARKSKNLPDNDEDAAPEWPAINSYTDKDGLVIRVFKAAYAVAGSNKFSVRPKGARI